MTDEPKKLTVRDLTPAQRRILLGMGNSTAPRKLTKILRQLIDLKLVFEVVVDGETRYARTAEGARLGMELHRLDRLAYEYDSTGKKRRRRW